jgi:hypothetical protein
LIGSTILILNGSMIVFMSLPSSFCQRIKGHGLETRQEMLMVHGLRRRMGRKSSSLLCLFVILTSARPSPAAELELGQAVVVTPATLSGPERKAVQLLVEEIEKRTLIRWTVAHNSPASDRPVVAVGSVASLAAIAGPNAAAFDLGAGKRPEGFRLRAARGSSPAVLLAGQDARGVLFGVGRLLRELRMTRGHVTILDGIDVATAPRYPLRGHQLGYRPKTNSYDGWDLAQWEQYIRDLAVFGTNAVELIPPRSDDAADSPHFPLPPMEMMVGMSKLLDDYGLDVWIWYPALDRDYADPQTVEFALKEWGEVFRKLPRVDAVFVPGGDPGHTQPKHLLALLEKQTQNLHRWHPRAQMWVSPQSFSQQWLDEFCNILREQQPAWLTGVVYGPQVRGSLPELRARIPERYPIRRYPDITHSLRCQYPVPNWDVAFALTEGRECINPRPLDEAAIFQAFSKSAIGFITYSEGCNDDVNKILWSGLGWDPEASVHDILRQYSRYFLGERYRDDFAQGLLALERNWRGPLATNESIQTTLRQFQDLEKAASPRDRLNWRFQQALYRVYFDAYVRSRLLYETSLEEKALDALRFAPRTGARLALRRAEASLDCAETEPVAADLRARVFELGEALFQSIRMQLSVERYQAIDVGRGANLDTIDRPLNNREWLLAQFAQIRGLADERERLRGIERLLQWTDPGPGGFYADLGNPGPESHIVPGLPYAQDPGFLRSPMVGFDHEPAWRLSWCRHAASLYDAPLRMHYRGLDPQAAYRIRILYTGDNFRPHVRLLANDRVEIHPFMRKPLPLRPVEFDVPQEATANGELTLTWFREPSRGDNGRGCQVAEVWLIKKDGW